MQTIARRLIFSLALAGMGLNSVAYGQETPAARSFSAGTESGGVQRDVFGNIEKVSTTPLPHWLWLSDSSLGAMPDGRAYLFDGDSGRMLGSLNTGYSFVGLTLASHYREIYSAETYYSRHTRGERTDLVSIYDPVDLKSIAEIIIPTKRASTIPRLNDAAISDNDRFMAVYNITPATSLSVVDLKERKFVAEIPTPGCSMAYPAGAQRFFSLCTDGSLLMVTLKDDGSQASTRRSKRFFNVNEDPILENGMRIRKLWLFISVLGKIYPVDVSAVEPGFQPPWSMIEAAGKGLTDEWRPSGMQGLAAHRDSNSLYVLMHQGGFFTYEEPGRHVWMLDALRRKYRGEIELIEDSISIQVTQDASPLLFAVRAEKPALDVYDATTGKHLRTIEEIGMTPFLLHTPVH